MMITDEVYRVDDGPRDKFNRTQQIKPSKKIVVKYGIPGNANKQLINTREVSTHAGNSMEQLDILT